MRIAHAHSFNGRFIVPGDKSISHRAVLFGAMADEPVTVRNLLDSADTRSTLDALMKRPEVAEIYANYERKVSR